MPRQTYDRLTRYADTLHLQLTLQAALLPLATTSRPIRLHWIVIEDGASLDPAISHLLQRSPISQTYLSRPTPDDTQHRGLAQRNAALEYIRHAGLQGVVCFSDDDNAFRPELLHSLSRIPEASYSIFPVGNTGYFGLEGPILAETSDALGPVTIEQWSCDFCERRWNVDMGGLAFHTSILHANLNIGLSEAAAPGHLETNLLEQFEQLNQSLILLPELLDQVHVWHDHSLQFHRAGYYDANWRTEAVSKERMRAPTEVVRGFSWANETLPKGTIV